MTLFKTELKFIFFHGFRILLVINLPIPDHLSSVIPTEVPEISGGGRSVLGAAGGAALLACGVRAPPRLALRLHTAATDRRVYGAARLHNAPPLLKLNVSIQ